MAASSRMSKELPIPMKSWTGNGDLIIDNGGSDRSPVRIVPVLYYLSRNGHLEHPHLIDVPLSSPHGLYLRDVMNTLNYRRGNGMANMYSWSFKRSYKSGYVWHDASKHDLIQPTNGHDYVLKGSELLESHPSETYHTGDKCTSSTMAAAAMVVRRNQSWSSFDNIPPEYLVLKCESNRELAGKFAPDAATQTEEHRRQKHIPVELITEEIPSPPTSNSSSDGTITDPVIGSRYVDDQTTEVKDHVQIIEGQNGTSGRMKVSQVLMQLITCGTGTDSVSDVRPVESKQDQRCSVSVVYDKSVDAKH